MRQIELLLLGGGDGTCGRDDDGVVVVVATLGEGLYTLPSSPLVLECSAVLGSSPNQVYNFRDTACEYCLSRDGAQNFK